MSPIILQVEDDANDVFFFQRAMAKLGAAGSVQVARDGQQAIDYLNGTGKFADRSKFPLPALVLLDLKLPRVMGLEVLKWIRKQPGVPRIVIILSASADQGDIAAAYRLGANAFLIKPAEVSKLDELARSIKDFWLKCNSPPQEDSEEGNLPRGGDTFRELYPGTRSGKEEPDYFPEEKTAVLHSLMPRPPTFSDERHRAYYSI
jgi:CheY-like chemotaxis protein